MTNPRAVIGVAEPPASRARLRGVCWLIAHEVGVNTPPTGRYRSADPAQVLDDARAVADYGASSGRTWEYTGMIGLDGSRFTQAGEYVAAHCRDFNDESAGLVFVNAVDVPVNAAQVASWHQWRDELVAAGVLAADHAVAPHYRFRSTACPGIRAEEPGKAWASPTGEGRLGELIPALRTTPVPPTPTEDDMNLHVTYTGPQTPGATRPELLLVQGKLVGFVSPADRNAAVWATKAQPWPISSAAQYDELVRAYRA